MQVDPDCHTAVTCQIGWVKEQGPEKEEEGPDEEEVDEEEQ